jgi:gas vesicle protein
MRDRDNTDLWTALAIGAVVGIGAALLARSRQDETNDLQGMLKRLKPTRKRAARMVKNARRAVSRGAHQAGEAGEDLVHASRDMLTDLRKNAREIVHTTRDELEKVARNSVLDARKAARRAARRTFG